MAEEPTTVAPFSSETMSLSPKETFDLRMRNRDVVFLIRSHEDDNTAHIIHLKNVCDDTLADAENAVNAFLDQFEPLPDDGSGHTVFPEFDKVYTGMIEHVDRSLRCVEDVDAELLEIDYDSIRFPKRAADAATQAFNPLAEIRHACKRFTKDVSAIRSKAEGYREETQTRRDAMIYRQGGDKCHGQLASHAAERSRKSDLGCSWYKFTYPGWYEDTFVNVRRVCFDQEHGWLLKGQ